MRWSIRSVPISHTGDTMFSLCARFAITWIAGIVLAQAPGTAPAADGTREEPVNQLSAEERAAGFRLLFDGKSLAGWEHNGRPG